MPTDRGGRGAGAGEARALLGLGANLGRPAEQLREALRRLGALGEVVAVSSVYETEPVGHADQPDFLNLVCVLRTRLEPETLLRETQRIEAEMGRERPFANAARTIDIDLLDLGGRQLRAPGLELPHPRLHERAFVLVPLAEVAPEWRHPVHGLTAAGMLGARGGWSRVRPASHQRTGAGVERQTGRDPGAYPASDFTVGVEEEYQLVDAETGELISRARALLAADWTGTIQQEMQQNTIEVQTRVCASTREVGEELARLRLQAAIAAETPGVRVVAAGTHPFSGGEHIFTPSPVYERIREEYRRLAETQHIFGQHIHVSVPQEVDRAQVLNVVREYSSLLLALSASSPLLRGGDTGYASYRWVLWRRWPRSGPPPRLRDWSAFEGLVSTLIRTSCMDAPGRLYWEVRPHHVYPTVEFRIADVTPRLDDALTIAALARALVAATVEGTLVASSLDEPVLHTLLVENSWRAARYGVEAKLVDLWGAEPMERPAREVLLRLAERLEPVAARLGDAAALAGLPALLERGEAARRIRKRWEAGGDPKDLVRWLADETVLGLGMDRRTAQRDDA